MGDRSDKFICLAEYWCLCVPVGKPVSERTMDRHRKLINVRRASLGLLLLPRGPRYTPEGEAYQYSRRVSMNASQNPFSHLFSVMEFQNNPIALIEASNGVNNPVESDTRHANRANFTSQQNTSAEIGGAESSSPRAAGSVETSASSEPPPDGSNIEFVGDGEIDCNAVTAGYSENSSASTSGDELNLTEDSEGAVTDSNTMEIHQSGMRSHAFLRFQSWAHDEKDWVQTFVEFGITNRLMRRLLELKKAPLVPITLKRNLIKYSSFETALYQTCLGHMLIGKLPEDSDSDEIMGDTTCSVCKERSMSPEFSTFEYLKLLPRFRSWVENEDSCRHLFEYWQEQIRERSDTDQAYGPGIFYSDIIDGQLFRRIADNNGGLAHMEYDITLAVSCDGFQTFSNNSYDCWPIVALNHNLPPSMRFLIHNLIPLGFIKGPAEPVMLDTFLTPLLEEVSEINGNGGTAMTFFDGVERIVRVHIVVFTGDTPAVAKLAGITGSNGKTSCRLCEHQGVYCSHSRHYYFPSKIRVSEEGRVRQSWKQIYDLEQPEMRSQEGIEATLIQLEDEGSLTRAQRERMQRETGIKKRTVTLRFPTIIAYDSFPLDTMHLIMNISKDMMELVRGENRVINRTSSEAGVAEEFVISLSGLRTIDSEVATIASGTAASTFGNAPRQASEYKSWKAVECKDFFRWYAVILFEGHMSSSCLNGIRTLSAIFERCTWPTLSQEDVDDLKGLCRSFIQYFEDRYFKYDLERVGVCKSTIHALLHLGRTVELCGPLVNVNQFWVERYIGAIKHRFNARRLAAEALTENAKLTESYKMYYKEHFAASEDSAASHDAQGSFCISGMWLLSPVEAETLQDPIHVRYKTRIHLEGYICRTEGLAEAEAKRVVSDASLWSHGRVKVKSSGNDVVFGAMKAKRHRKNMKRADYLVSCEFLGLVENKFEVYYGRLLKILHLRYELHGEFRDVPVILIDWAQRLAVTTLGQVYKRCRAKQAFGSPSVEHMSILSGSIGILEHRIPGSNSPRTYFIDPAREVNHLLRPNRAGPDGKTRELKGLQ